MALDLNRSSGILKSLGPGLLWAGAAIGVSHLVQSTRAGASFGFALVWAVILANVFKYPFFEFGPRYAAATGESLLEGYRRLGRWTVAVFTLLTFGTMFTVLAAVTAVTAGLAARITGLTVSPLIWCAVLLAVCGLILIPGRYPLLDKTIKAVIVLLTLSTLTALVIVIVKGGGTAAASPSRPIWDLAGISFLVALMGWMPSAIDISVWHSLWTLERRKQTHHAPTVREALFDFNLGYFGTAVLALCFLALGALVMHGSGDVFATSGLGFAEQFLSLYTRALGEWAYPIVLVAAFTTMFSTTLTVTDAFPRVMQKLTTLSFPRTGTNGRGEWLYWGWMLVVVSGALLILGFLSGRMTVLVDLATTLSFLTAPILAYINLRVVTAPHMPAAAIPPPWLRWLSWSGIFFLSGFSVLFLVWRLGFL